MPQYDREEYYYTMSSEQILDCLLDPSHSHEERLNNALFQATEDSFIELIIKIIKAGANINAYNEYEDTPLHIATENEDEQVIQTLLEHGADVTLVNRDGKTAYMVAMENDNPRIAEYLK